jgi:hypothetical protein
MFDGYTYEHGYVVNAQLGHQVAPALLDGFQAHLQYLGDGNVGGPFGDELQYLPWPSRLLS